MRALQCETLGKPSDLKLVAVPDLPSPKAGEIKVQVASAGLNFADTLMIAGQYQHKPELPFTPGLELAGTVLEVGPGETRIKPGDPIMAAVDHGGFAGQAIVRAADAVPIPAGLDPVVAGGFVMSVSTIYLGSLVAMFLIAGLFHLNEAYILVHGMHPIAFIPHSWQASGTCSACPAAISS